MFQDLDKRWCSLLLPLYWPELNPRKSSWVPGENGFLWCTSGIVSAYTVGTSGGLLPIQPTLPASAYHSVQSLERTRLLRRRLRGDRRCGSGFLPSYSMSRRWIPAGESLYREPQALCHLTNRALSDKCQPFISFKKQSLFPPGDLFREEILK